MRYQNLKPSLPDTLRALRTEVTKGDTVPHGVKTVTPGEGLQLLSGDGSEIFWDWATAQDYNDRITAGSAALAEAEANLAQTRLDLDAAAARIDTAEMELVAADAKITAEQTARAQAVSRLEGVDATLQAAQGVLESKAAQAATDLVGLDSRLSTARTDLDAAGTKLAGLETTVGSVSAAVTASEVKTAEALAKAVLAQTSADGKNRITRSVSPASGPGLAVGDTHQVMSSMGGGGRVVRQQRWDGATWQDETLSHQMLSSVDLGTATVGLLDGQYIKAGSVTTDKVVVGAGENLLPDSALLSETVSAARTLGTGWRIIPRASDGVRVLTTNSATRTDAVLTDTATGWIQVDPTGKYQMTLTVGGPNQVGVYLRLLFSDGSTGFGTTETRLDVSGGLPVYRVEWDLGAQGQPVAIRPYVRRYETPAGATNFYTQVATLSLRRKVNSVLIEDGAITGEKINAQSVAAAVGQFIDLTATTINVDQLRATGTATIGTAVVDRIWADLFTSHKVTTEELVVGSGTNLIPNGWGEKGNVTGTGWEAFSISTDSATNAGQPAAVSLGASESQSAKVSFPVKAGTEYHFSVWAKANLAGSRFYLQVYTDAGSTYLVSGDVVPNGSWKEYTVSYTPPAGSSKVTHITVYALHSSGTQSVDGLQWFGAFTLTEKTTAVTIADGAITTPKLAVTEEMSARIVNAMSLTAKTGIFTDGLTAVDSTLLGNTVAQALTVTKLVARDVIATGTVDVAQLNVTAALSAEVVRTMSVETKQLIVTEDAILNNATVVQSLVTPQLIAEKINAQSLAADMVAAGLLQTSTAPNAGVKITGTGIKAWNALGDQSMNFDGKNNYMIGELSTAPDKQRVRLRSSGSIAAADFFGSNNTVDHLGIWHQSDAGSRTASRIIAQNELSWSRDNPGMILFPLRGDFSFNGRWARNGDSVKYFSAVNYNGLAPGAWVDLTYTYTTPFRTTYVERAPFVSVEARSGAECVAAIKSQTETKITVRVTNKSNNASDVLYLRGMTMAFNTVEYSDSW